uniref:Uncharacterized protein n=1 Tax=Poecilia reticulata TaxID=8081 RepID=A0A3P9P767_POERE
MQRKQVLVQKSIFGGKTNGVQCSEIVKRLSAICAQIIPFLSQEVSAQQQLQHLSHHAPGIPLTPHPSGLSLGAGSSGLLALTGALGVSAHLASKDERNHLDPEHLRGKKKSVDSLPSKTNCKF